MFWCGPLTTRALPTATTSLKLFLALTYAKSPEPFDVLGGVIAMPIWSTLSQRHRPEPLAEAEPTGGYAELVGDLLDTKCVCTLKHTHTVT
jgi:hypothetical protein